jgi:23S rRNA (pseudouridine1915-N3)-methyltransferase
VRYRVVAVGQLKRGFYRDGVDYYLKRLSAYGKVEVQELKDSKMSEPESVKEDEGARLLAAASGHLVLLDERGELYDTRGLAARVTALETSGVSLLSLLIGGAEGHGQAARKAAREAWSLSALTLPHELARLVILEQLYRIETVRAGHPYHRES